MSTPPSGAFLAGNLVSGESFLIDASNWERRPTGLAPGEVTASAFSPDGRHLVTVDLAGDLTLRDPQTFRAVRTFQGDAGTANSFTILPLGFPTTAAAVSAHDGQGRLWDVESGQLIGRPLDSLPSSAPSAVLGAHPGFIAVTDRWVQYWRFDSADGKEIACRMAGRNLTEAEWAQFGLGTPPTGPPAPQWGTDGKRSPGTTS